jgi:hypothetical protein
MMIVGEMPETANVRDSVPITMSSGAIAQMLVCVAMGQKDFGFIYMEL